MDIGLCVASKIDDIPYVARAEQLGYTHAWFADSQMIWSDCYACLALAATQTSTIQLGTGVSVVGTRTAPVTAHSIATINRLAPGRTFLALGNGNTAWRLMGHKPVNLATFTDYVRVVRGLLDGEEVSWTHRGRTTPIQFQMPDLGFIDLEPRIPIYVSGFGPKSQAMAGRYGDGLVMSIPPEPWAMERTKAHVTEGAKEGGRTLDWDDFLTCSLTAAAVLRPGEDLTSERIVRSVGPFVVSSLHYTYDKCRQYGTEPPRHLHHIWERYTELVEATPEPVRHNRIHVGHCTFTHPDEVQFVTPELIESMCLVGSPSDIVAKLEALDGCGLDQLMLLPSLESRFEALEEFGQHVLPRL